MDGSFDVIVIGVGSMGAAACYHLAKRGLRVLGLEQFAVPHDQGAGHGFSRMIRLAYHEHPDYVPLLLRAYQLWDEIENESDQKLLYITGGLYAGAASSQRLARTQATAERFQLPHERLDREEIGRRFPQFHLPDDFAAIYEPRAGFVKPELAIATHVRMALTRGAEIHAHEGVSHWQADGHGVSVDTPRGTYRADRLLLAGGAWSGKLLADLRIPLTVTRQVLGWTWPRRPELFQLGEFPVWSIAREDGSSHYGFPMMSDNPGFKTAHHRRGAATDPDRVERGILPGDEEDFRYPLERYIPEAQGPTLALRTCLYTNTPDGQFILDRHPDHPRVTLACGFSGHGFKFMTVMGEVLSQLTMGESPTLPIDFLSLSRFTG